MYLLFKSDSTDKTKTYDFLKSFIPTLMYLGMVLPWKSIKFLSMRASKYVPK